MNLGEVTWPVHDEPARWVMPGYWRVPVFVGQLTSLNFGFIVCQVPID